MFGQRKARFNRGDRIGERFRVHQVLMGGMGEVYLCLDERGLVPRALKTFQGSSVQQFQTFNEEVSNWIALEKHPNIVRCYQTQHLDGVPFMILEWILGDREKGTNLRSWLRGGALETQKAVKFTIDMARGLDHANEIFPGIVHRDLKPENVLISLDHLAKITDFGLSKVYQEIETEIIKSEAETPDDLSHSMRVGNVVGTPPYMAPEQWRGENDLDFRTDFYAIGCMLYEMLTGVPLFIGTTMAQYRQLHTAATLPPLDDVSSAALKAIIERCIAKDRADRYATVAELLAELETAYEDITGEALPPVSKQEFTAAEYQSRGVTYRVLGRFQEAIQDFNRSIEMHEEQGEYRSDLYVNRANAYAGLGMMDQALADFAKAIEYDPEDAAAYSDRAVIHRALGNLEAALEDASKAVELDPEDFIARNSRGLSYQLLGRLDEAMEDYDMAIHTIDRRTWAAKTGISGAEDGIARTYFNRANVHRIRGDHEAALQDMEDGLKASPFYALGHVDKGNLLSDLGRFEQAMAAYDTAIEIEPNSKDAWWHKARSLIVTNQIEAAIQHGHRALQLGHPDAMKNLPVLQQIPSAQPDPNGNALSAQELFDRFAQSRSEAQMALLVRQYPQFQDPGLRQAIRGAIETQITGSAQRMFQHLFNWLEQIVAHLPGGRGQAAFDAFQRANSYFAMKDVVKRYPELKQMIPQIQQIIAEQVPEEHQTAFEQRLSWLKQISEGGEEDESGSGEGSPEEALMNMVTIYRQYGEAAIRQALTQQGVPAEQIDRMLLIVKQLAGGQ